MTASNPRLQSERVEVLFRVGRQLDDSLSADRQVNL